MRKITLLFISAILITLSCSKEESDMRLAEFNTPVLTGFELRDMVGNTLGTIGTPNIKLGNESNDYSSEYLFITYPNPCRDKCTIYLKTPDSNKKKQIWIVEALYNDVTTSTSTNIGNTSLLGLGGTPLLQSEIKTKNAVFDLSSLTEGYYRIYPKVDDFILYDNLIDTNN